MSRIELETTIHASPERRFDLSRSVELHLEPAAGTGERRTCAGSCCSGTS